MRRPVGTIVLGLSACGYPLTQAVIQRWGAQGQVLDASILARTIKNMPELAPHPYDYRQFM
ncbi:MAG: hypothetical protein ACLQGJ_05300 [Candidatus Dormibacteria bacterium]